MRSLAILGAGGHGRVVADCAECLDYGPITFFDDRTDRPASPWPVAGDREALLSRLAEFDAFVVAVGDNAARLDLHRTLVAAGGRPATLVPPGATVSRYARIGPGTVVFSGCVVNIGAIVGEACILNTGCGVDHDDRLADGVHISPGAHLAGGVSVGELAWIGIGAAVREGVSIGRAVRVGAGAVVVGNIPDSMTVVGNPARELERRSDA